ncbi:M55 family metallopeptidase [Paenibacillus eucommiae]|uniref:D-amino peptidase n=1 Tax=Paenibacillus eucommiae TaxID=1355755 RepID=A0ABS4J434_9BACL|nr:M55 family metallopeptidase [Paenibacillus eucommiae]MBP1994045.1 D-amino peptidase [Paenibacillus eucommiae]
MKIYLMTDMEGVCGVASHDIWVTPEGRYYEAGKELLTREINAAVEGFFAAGADEIVVIDGHGYGGINQLLLDNRVSYVRGALPGPYPFMLDETYDAIAWVGQHAKAGAEYAHLAHTGWFNVLDYQINGTSVGEFGQFAMLGAFLGVRSIFGAGDEAFVKEASALVPGIETVSVKKGLMPGSGDEYDCEGYRERNNGAIHIHPEKARLLIREGAEKALRRFIQSPEQFTLLDVKAPFTKEVRYRSDGRTPAHTKICEHPDDIITLLNM